MGPDYKPSWIVMIIYRVNCHQTLVINFHTIISTNWTLLPFMSFHVIVPILGFVITFVLFTRIKKRWKYKFRFKQILSSRICFTNRFVIGKLIHSVMIFHQNLWKLIHSVMIFPQNLWNASMSTRAEQESWNCYRLFPPLSTSYICLNNMVWINVKRG